MPEPVYLVVALGSIGKRHLKNLRALRKDATIVVLRHLDNHNPEIPVDADHVVTNMDAALAMKPEAALIASPSSYHIKQGLLLAQNNCHLFIEKPISHNLVDVETLIEQCEKKNLLLQTGYNFRFNGPARRVKEILNSNIIGDILHVSVDTGQYLPDWRPDQDYTKSVSASRELGGGVLLELSHEFDYLRWYFGDVTEIFAKGGNSGTLEIDVEDCVDVLMTFENGLNANVHIDMLQRVPSRVCKITGSKGTLIWNAIENQVRIYWAESKDWSTEYHKNNDSNLMYLAELEHFLNNIESGNPAVISGRDGLAVLKIVEAAKQSIETSSLVKLNKSDER